MSGPETGRSEAPGEFLASLVAVLRSTFDPWDLGGVFLKGLFMGAADTVPGVSGGTIALVTGIYERLIAAITAVDVDAALSAWRLHDPDGRSAFLDLVERVDVPFLAALGLGVITAVVTVAQALEAIKATFPAATFAAFFGLIAASAVVLYGEVDVSSPRRVGLAVAGIVVAGLVAGLAGGEPGAAGGAATIPLWYVFVAGTIAISAMVLPGVSGAFLLILLGAYGFMLDRLNEVTGGLVGLVDGGDPATLVGPVLVVVTFVAGACVGLLTVANAIRWALDNYRDGTLIALVSLMVGGLVAPAQRVAASYDPTPAGYALVVLGVVIGAGGVFLFDRYTDDMDY